jgi:hypothetical protein
VVVSSRGTNIDRALALRHEGVHQFLAPKLYLLREYRVSNVSTSYTRSSLWRFIEEALAEAVAQVGVLGFRNVFSGIRFPVKEGYVYLRRGGGYNAQFEGFGMLPEASALLYHGVVAGIAFELRFNAGTSSTAVVPAQ